MGRDSRFCLWLLRFDRTRSPQGFHNWREASPDWSSTGQYLFNALGCGRRPSRVARRMLSLCWKGHSVFDINICAGIFALCRDQGCFSIYHTRFGMRRFSHHVIFICDHGCSWLHLFVWADKSPGSCLRCTYGFPPPLIVQDSFHNATYKFQKSACNARRNGYCALIRWFTAVQDSRAQKHPRIMSGNTSVEFSCMLSCLWKDT